MGCTSSRAVGASTAEVTKAAVTSYSSDNDLLPPESNGQRDCIAEWAGEAIDSAALGGDGIGIGSILDVASTVGSFLPTQGLEDNPVGEILLEAGTALLEAFEHVPFVAPAAFLIGAVARASAEAVILRDDARSYAEAARRVEKAMLKARTMETQREAVGAIVAVLEESLVLVKHLASRGMMASVVRACRDAKKLADYKEDLTEAVGLLQLECQIELNAIKCIELNQARELEARIDEMGGLEECAACPEKTAALTMLMKKSDALMIAKVDVLARQTRTSMNEVSNSVHRLSMMQTSGQASIDAHFAMMQLEAEKAATRNAVMEQQVSTLTNMLGDVKDLLVKCPVPTNEPARLMAVRAAGAVGMSPKADAYPEIERCASEVWKLMEGKVCVAVNFISEDTSHYPVFYLLSPDASEPANMAIDDADSVTSPRKANVCQHVIHRAETVEFIGMENAPPQLTPAEFQVVSAVDPTIAQKTALNKEQGVVCDKENGCPFNAIWWDLQVHAAGTVWYRGQPIFSDGVAIGSFCCVSPEGKPDDFDSKVKRLVDANVVKIGVTLERQAAKRRAYHLSQLAGMTGAAAGPAREWAEFGMAKMPPAGCPLPPVRAIDPNDGAVVPNLFDRADDLVNFVY